jgi:hypothetical protein
LLFRFKITFIDFNRPACPFQLIFGIGKDDFLTGDVGAKELRDAVGCLLLAAADVGQADAVSKISAAEGVEIGSVAEVSKEPFQSGSADDIAAVVIIVDVVSVSQVRGSGFVTFRGSGVNPKGGPELLQPLTDGNDVVLLILKVRAKALNDEGNGFLPGEEDKAGA